MKFELFKVNSIFKLLIEKSLAEIIIYFQWHSHVRTQLRELKKVNLWFLNYWIHINIIFFLCLLLFFFLSYFSFEYFWVNTQFLGNGYLFDEIVIIVGSYVFQYFWIGSIQVGILFIVKLIYFYSREFKFTNVDPGEAKFFLQEFWVFSIYVFFSIWVCF